MITLWTNASVSMSPKSGLTCRVKFTWTALASVLEVNTRLYIYDKNRLFSNIYATPDCGYNLKQPNIRKKLRLGKHLTINW